MNKATLIPLLVTVILPLFWLIAEFKAQKTFRMALGIIAFVCALVMIFLMSWITKIEILSPTAESLHKFIETVSDKLEDGNIQKTLSILKVYDAQYDKTTSAQEKYLSELENIPAKLKANEPAYLPEDQNATFSKETWNGLWSNDRTNWFYISPNYANYDIFKDGKPPVTMIKVSVSEDFTLLSFQDSDKFRHTLKLHNKYQAEHECYDLLNKKIITNETITKFVFPSEDQMKYTRIKE